MMETILAVPITVIRMMTPIMRPKTIVIQILIQMTQTVLLAIQVHHPAVIDALGTLKSTVIDVVGWNGLCFNHCVSGKQWFLFRSANINLIAINRSNLKFCWRLQRRKAQFLE